MIDTGGTAWCWGSDGSGELGDGDDGQGDEPAPVAVTGGHTWAALSAGAGHTCGIDTAGKAWCWGRDDYGQVGDGADGQAGEPVPVPVRSLENRTWRAIAAGWDHTCGIDTDGKAWCWGKDEFGQVGDGDDGQAAELSPVPVAGPGAVPVTWMSLSAGGYHTCGIDTAGNAWCWGSDTYGQVGDGKGSKWAPVAVVGARLWRSVAAGGYHTCGIDTAGKAYCWGWDSYGQIGDGDDSEATQVNPGPLLDGGRAWSALVGGTAHNCGVDAAGNAWCWGLNTAGQVGNGGPTGRFAELSPAQVGVGRAWSAVAGGYSHSCAIDAAGSAWCWGDDTHGQVGDGGSSQAAKNAPVQVAARKP